MDAKVSEPSHLLSQKEVQPWKFLMDDLAREGVGLPAGEVRGSVLQVPGLPGEGMWAKEFEDELHQQAVVLVF